MCSARSPSSWLAWVNAGAYFCTGFVRRAVESWWVLYLAKHWAAGKESTEYAILVWTLPLSAFVGSFSSGLLSDTLFKGKRVPVAALLFTIETVVIGISVLLLGHSDFTGPTMAVVLLTLISLTCNSTHSIIGTAAAMDLGGRKMAGFALGRHRLVPIFRRHPRGFPARRMDRPLRLGRAVLCHAALQRVGAMLMIYIWLTTRGRDVKGS